jgi:hypothetical protein
MKMYYRAKLARVGTEIVYSQTGQPVFCCEEMARQWGRLLGFGVQGHGWTTSREVNLYSVDSIPTLDPAGGGGQTHGHFRE